MSSYSRRPESAGGGPSVFVAGDRVRAIGARSTVVHYYLRVTGSLVEFRCGRRFHSVLEHVEGPVTCQRCIARTAEADATIPTGGGAPDGATR